MVSAMGQSGSRGASGQPGPTSDEKDQSRLLPVLAAERLVRAALLIGVGVILLTHVHADWVDLARSYAARAGLDPSRNETGRLISSLARFGPRQLQRGGEIAIGYGLLETIEGYGLLRRRQWGEYLTVVSTALLFVPEIHELLTRPTGLKWGGFLLNVVIVVYLVIRIIRRRRAGTHHQSS
jgi:uncharacterized membrane protein (DUF2068 family)